MPAAEKAATALSNGRIDLAIKNARKIPDVAERNAALAASYRELGDDEKAFRYLRKAYLASKDCAIAVLYARGLIERGRAKQAVKILADHPTVDGRMALASAYVSLSEIDKACDIYREAIRRFPDYLPAYLALAPLMRHDKSTPCQPDKLKGFLESVEVPASRLDNIHYCLGIVYEDLGKYRQAFNHYSKAAEMRRKQFPECIIPQHKQQLAKVKSHFTKELLAEVPPQRQHCPLVFVFGMPRSGTTLTEQILVAHPEIETLGESPNVMDEIEAIRQGDFDADDPDAATRLYVQRRIGELRSRFMVDKMCGNWQYLGLMYQLFPAARFVYVKRDALNNCFATWSTLFARGHAYSYTFEEMAAEYKIHEEYMRHWFNVLPAGTIHEVRYEELVTDRQHQTRRLLDYIGVEWNDACMEPHKIKRDVKTASLAQVVRPVYTSSVDRAARFGSMLDPLREALA